MLEDNPGIGDERLPIVFVKLLQLVEGLHDEDHLDAKACELRRRVA
jgi:hypothetical protein